MYQNSQIQFMPAINLLFVILFLASSTIINGQTLTINDLADSPDAYPGDGACEDLSGLCTLRAAIEEANASGASEIVTSVSGNIILSSDLPLVQIANLTIDLTDDITIDASSANIGLDLDANDISLLATTIIDASNNGVRVSGNNCLINSCTFSGNVNRGILLDGSANSIISDNTSENSISGIVLISNSDNVLLENNNCTNNSFAGISLGNSDGVTLDGNIQNSNGQFGFRLSFCNGFTMDANTANSNLTEGISVEDCTNSSIIDCETDNNGGRGILIDNSTAITLTDNALTGNVDGIYAESSSSLTLSGNNVDNNTEYGIEFNTTNNSTITDCIVHSNGSDGIYMGGGSIDNNTIEDCEVYSNTNTGVYIGSGVGRIVQGSQIYSNGINGIYILGGDSDLIETSEINSNSNYGISFQNCIFGEINDNVLNSNTSTGITITGSDNTTINSNELSANGGNGISATLGSNGAAITDNIVNGSGIDAIKLEGSSNSAISDNNLSNNFQGVLLQNSTNCDINGNSIDGTNNSYGIRLSIGCSSIGMDDNTVTNTTGNGIDVYDSDALLINSTIHDNSLAGLLIASGSDVDVSETSFSCNGSLGIQNNVTNIDPVISAATETMITGTACSGCTVEFYEMHGCSDCEGEIFDGSTTASGGSFSYSHSTFSAGDEVVALVRDGNTTSEFVCAIVCSPPVNDECGDAITLDIDAAAISEDNSCATGESFDCGDNEDHVLWYNFETTTTQINFLLDISAGTASTPFSAALFEACNMSNLITENCNIGNSSIGLSCLEPDTEYFLMIGSESGNEGTYTVRLIDLSGTNAVCESAYDAGLLDCGQTMDIGGELGSTGISGSCVEEGSTCLFNVTAWKIIELGDDVDELVVNSNSEDVELYFGSCGSLTLVTEGWSGCQYAAGTIIDVSGEDFIYTQWEDYGILDVTARCCGDLDNETCNDAFELSIDTPQEDDNTCGEFFANDCGINEDNTLWYEFEVTELQKTVQIVISPITSNSFFAIEVYDDCSLSNLVSTSNCNNINAWISCTDPSVTYFMLVSSTTANAGSYEIEVRDATNGFEICELAFDAGEIDCGQVIDFSNGNFDGNCVEGSPSCLNNTGWQVLELGADVDELEINGDTEGSILYTGSCSSLTLIDEGLSSCEYADGTRIPVVGGTSIFIETIEYNSLNIKAYCCGDFDNDICGDAHILTDGNTETDNNTCADSENSSCANNENVLWYEFQVSANSNYIQIELDDISNAFVEVYDECGGSSLASWCNFAGPEFACVTPGESVYIQVGSDAVDAADFDITITEEINDADFCGNANDLGTLTCDDIFTTEPGTLNTNCPDAESAGCTMMGGGIWNRFSLDAEIIDFMLDNISGNFELFEGSDCNNLTQVGDCDIGPFDNNGDDFFLLTDDDDPNFDIIPRCLCELMDLNIDNIECDDNGTPEDPRDDFIFFEMEPEGEFLDLVYFANAVPGIIDPTTASYGSVEEFRLQDGSAGGGDVLIEVIDAADPDCLLAEMIEDTGNCCVEPENLVCNDAIEIFIGADVSAVNLCDSEQTNTTCSSDANGLWYTFTTDQTTSYIDFEIVGLTDPFFQLYDECGGDLVQDYCSDVEFEVCVTPNTVYYLHIGSDIDDAEFFEFNIEESEGEDGEICLTATDQGNLVCDTAIIIETNTVACPDSEAFGCMEGVSGVWQSFTVDPTIDEFTITLQSGDNWDLFEGDDCGDLNEVEDCGYSGTIDNNGMTFYLLMEDFAQLTIEPICCEEEMLAVDESICQGEIFVLGGQSFSSSVTNEMVFIEAVIPGACDTIATLNLDVIPIVSLTIDESICTGETYTLGGQSFTTSVTGAQVTLPSMVDEECDTLATLNLTVADDIELAIDEAICSGETFTLYGVDYTTSQVDLIIDIPSQVVGTCDTVVTFNLQVEDNILINVDEVICEGETFMLGGQVFTMSVANEQIPVASINPGECDTLFTLNLTVISLVQEQVTERICEGDTYVLGGRTFTETTIDEIVTLPAALPSECDTTITLNLEVVVPERITDNASICTGASYTVGDQTFTTAVTGEEIILPARVDQDCDTTIVLNLTVDDNILINLDESICSGTSFELGGNSYTMNLVGEQVFVASQVQGDCDTIFTLDLEVIENVELTEDASICDGDIYAFKGQDYTTEQIGTMISVPSTVMGECDTVFTLNLEVKPEVEEEINASICTGETYTFAGMDYTSTILGELISVESVVADACDTLFTLNLSVADNILEEVNAEICSGGSFELGGNVYTTEQTGEQVMVPSINPGECDTIFTLNLSVTENIERIIDESICEGDRYILGGVEYTDEVNGEEITLVAASSNECDTLVNFTL